MVDRLLDEIAQAVAANAVINSFSCAIRARHLSLPVRMLTMAPQLKKFGLTLGDELFHDREQSMLVEAVRVNQSLQSYALNWLGRSEMVVNTLLLQASDPFRPLFPRLQSIYLRVTGTDEFPTPTPAHMALLTFLESTGENRPLHGINLERYAFNLLDATRVLAAFSASSCHWLYIASCKLNEEATGHFVQFVKQLNKSSNDRNRILCIRPDTEFEGTTFSAKFWLKACPFRDFTDCMCRTMRLLPNS
jgi:hypothetical protein